MAHPNMRRSMEAAREVFKKGQTSENDWPLEKRIADALDLFERTAKGGYDVLFRPSPFMVHCSLSAAREALGVLVQRAGSTKKSEIPEVR